MSDTVFRERFILASYQIITIIKICFELNYSEIELAMNEQSCALPNLRRCISAKYFGKSTMNILI
ncbi:hypothetical protein GCM10010918_26150 [Paenibacillus radicis (ex Gao et al. 2016)]|uniref:Uncharacterized protein n=1 Tax=Paenibacillus radicis (ex Gao et al. 2016) TaxID=1737354 RepID=A0A917M1X2_9BACL|nr:hypothetical protein GCM10010918_26150 [Paenibacillus radicis (ex Gao et al. 2016)]